jgi:predicted AAA+ superfamily ATPase
MARIYRRTELATRMAGQLLSPGVLDEGLRSGLFLAGLRRTGKTTFLLTDLTPHWRPPVRW